MMWILKPANYCSIVVINIKYNTYENYKSTKQFLILNCSFQYNNIDKKWFL